MIKTVKDLRDALKEYSDDTLVSILFECTEAPPLGFQYEVPILDIAGTSDHIILCHEEDYPNHYSRLK